MRSPGSRSSFGGPKGELRSSQNSTPSRPSIAATADDWRRQVSAASSAYPVATVGTCGTKKPSAPAATDRTASGQSRLKSRAPGSSSGSEVALRAEASSPAIPGVVAGRRPSHRPTTAAATHQPRASSSRAVSSSRAAPTTETTESAVAAPPNSRTATRRKSRNLIFQPVPRVRARSPRRPRPPSRPARLSPPPPRPTGHPP